MERHLFRSEFAKGSQGALDRPQILLEKAVRLQADFPEAHLEWAGLYAAQKQDQKAVDEYLEGYTAGSKVRHRALPTGTGLSTDEQAGLATQELARYQELSRLHQEELKRSRSAIQQFVLSQPARSAIACRVRGIQDAARDVRGCDSAPLRHALHDRSALPLPLPPRPGGHRTRLP